MFVVWPHGPERLLDFLSHLNSLRPSIQFSMDNRVRPCIAFLDIMVIREETTLANKVYRKPTHTGRYVKFNSNYPSHVKWGLIQSLHSRASTICQERQNLVKEISSLRSDLQLNDYPQGFIDSVIDSKGSGRLNEEQKPLRSVYIPYVKGTSEKLKCVGNRYNISTIFETKHTLRSSLMKTRLERDPQQMAQCIYSIHCVCGKSYIGDKGRPLAMRLHEHSHNLQQGLLGKSKLAQHAYEEGHKVGWDDARVLEIERNSMYRKYKKSAHMVCLTNAISQPSLDISPIWIPIGNEVSNSQRRSVRHERFFIVSIRFQSCVFRFYSIDGTSGRYYIPSQIFSIFCIGAHALGFVGYVCSTNFYLLFSPSSTHMCVLYNNFYCTFSCYIPTN
jgi:hypothetical protein